jgi:Protein of unknown function (DUF2478)
MISSDYTDHLLNLAAVIYHPADDVDGLLRDFALELIRRGHRVGGLVQHNEKNGQDPRRAMELIDLMSGRMFPISQASGDCKLDLSGLANAALAIGNAVQAGVELVIVNKFSTQEAAGKGLRDELAAAVAAGLLVLTAVPEKHLDAWTAFTGGFGTTLASERSVIDDWWQEISWRTSRRRVLAQLERCGEPGPGLTIPDGQRSQEDSLSLPITCR